MDYQFRIGNRKISKIVLIIGVVHTGKGKDDDG
jgi:hypothetical protein